MRKAPFMVVINKTIIENLIRGVSVAVTLLLASCSANYKVTAEFPTPLIQPISALVSLSLSDEFLSYQFVETRENKNDISIEIGEAQTALFSTMTEAMFTNDIAAKKQLVITPTVLDFQYAIPRETRAEIYEIWIKYRVLLEDDQGKMIADWLITGYGKTPTAFMKSPEEAIQAATVIALRDVGSQLSIGFSRQPDIKLWLDSYSNTDNGLTSQEQAEQSQI